MPTIELLAQVAVQDKKIESLKSKLCIAEETLELISQLKTSAVNMSFMAAETLRKMEDV